VANELQNSSLWQDLPAVKNNHVFEVDISYWMAAGAIAHSKKVDDVVRLVTQQ
jgi:iron complex transport system substrate-binding protein